MLGIRVTDIITTAAELESQLQTDNTGKLRAMISKAQVSRSTCDLFSRQQ